jgi:hypothetical protein
MVLASDSEKQPVVVRIEGLPAGAELAQDAGCCSWTPAAADNGRVFECRALAFNPAADGSPLNRYVEEFTVLVRDGRDCAVPNGGFEESASDAPAGWRFEGGGAGVVSLASDTRHAGARAARLSCSRPGDVRLIREVEVRPHTEYALVGYIRTSGVEGQQAAEIGAHVSLGGQRSQSVFGTTAGQTWIPVYATCRAGKEGKLEIECRLGHHGNTCTGAAWFDDLRLIELADPPPANLDFEQQAGGQPAAWAPECWQNRPDTGMEPDTEVVHGGRCAVRVFATEEENDVRYSQRVVLQPGRKYRVTAYVRTAGVEGGAGARVCLSNNQASSEGLHGDHDWTRVSFEYQPDEDAVVTLQCRLGGNGAVSRGTAWFDDVELIEIR